MSYPFKIWKGLYFFIACILPHPTKVYASILLSWMEQYSLHLKRKKGFSLPFLFSSGVRRGMKEEEENGGEVMAKRENGET